MPESILWLSKQKCLSIFILSIILCILFGSIADAQQCRISGFVIDENGFGIPGVEIQGLLGVPITDETGFYDEVVPEGWSGTITPVKDNFVFSPGQMDLQDITTHQSLINFQHTGSAVLELFRGLNLISVPSGIATITDIENWLFSVDALAGIEKALLYDPLSQSYVDIFPTNFLVSDEQVHAGQGIMLYCNQDATVAIALGQVEYKALSPGFNFRCTVDLASDIDSAFDLLTLFGGNMHSLQRYNPETGKFETAAMGAIGNPQGVDFPKRVNEGVFISMAEKNPPLIQFEARPSFILSGESAMLYWTAHFADEAGIDNGIGSVDVSGTLVVNPSETTTYTLTANNALATSTQQATVQVVTFPMPPSNLTATPLSGGRARLHWQGSTSADIGSYNIYCDHSNGTIDYQTPITTVDFLTFQYTTETLGDGPFIFGLRAVNQAGLEEKNTDVIVSAELDNTPPDAVTDLVATAESNGRVLLTWTGSISDDVSTYSVYYDGGSGDVDYTAPMITLPASMTSYTTPELEGGTYRFSVRATDAVGNKEENTQTVAATILFIDLSVSVNEVSFTPTEPNQGESVIVQAVVRNLGNTAAPAFSVKFSETTTTGLRQIGELQQIGNLAAGGSTTLSVELQITEGVSRKSVLIEADSSDAIFESNEVNNSVVKEMTVRTYADLYVSGADLELSVPEPTEGQTVLFSTTVQNIGGQPAQNVAVKFYRSGVDGTFIQIQSNQILDEVPAGEDRQASVQLDTTGVGSFITLFVKVDPDNDINEADETNNQATMPLSIGNPLLQMTISATSSAQPGQAVAYTVNYRNAGTRQAKDVELFLSYPTEFVFDSSSTPPTSGDNQWTLGTMEAGQSGAITIEGHLLSDAEPGSISACTAVLNARNALEVDLAPISAAAETLIGDDTIAPILTASLSPQRIASGIVQVTVSANENLESAPMVTAVDAQAASLSVRSATSSQDAYQFEVSVTDQSAEGTATASITALDTVGNQGSRTVVFVVDRTAPELAVSMPGTVGSGDFEIYVTANETLSSPPTLSAVDAGGMPVTITGGELVGGSYRYTATIDAGQSDGTAQLDVLAMDLAGNQVETGKQFEIDVQAPAITIDAPVVPVSTGRFEFAISTEGTSNYPTVVVQDAEGEEIRTFLTSIESGHFIFEGLVAFETAQGNASITASVGDAVGNIAAGTAEVEVDTVAPEFSLTIDPTPPQGDITLTVTSSVELSGDPQLVATSNGHEAIDCGVAEVEGLSYTWHFYTDSLADIQINGTDPAGNTGSIEQGFVDLAIDQGSLSLSCIPGLGQDVTINASVQNNSGIAINDVLVRAVFGSQSTGTIIDEVVIPAISSGATLPVQLSWGVNTQTQSYNLSIVVDPEEEIAETDEDNNIAILGTFSLSTEVENALYLNGSGKTAVITAFGTRYADGAAITDTDAVFSLSVSDSDTQDLILTRDMVYDNSRQVFTADIDVDAELGLGSYEVEVTAAALDNSATISRTVGFEVASSYDITLESNKTLYDRQETVILSGTVTESGSGQGVDGVEVTIRVSDNNGTRYSPCTTNDGSFSYTLAPSSGETGLHTAIAEIKREGITELSTEIEFQLLGLFMAPSSITVDTFTEISRGVDITLQNLGSEELTGIDIEVIDPDTADDLIAVLNTQSTLTDLAAGERTNFHIDVVPGVTVLSDQTFTVNVTTAQGAEETATVTVDVAAAVPGLRVTPSLQEIFLNPGGFKSFTVTVTNTGHGTLENVSISSPEQDWIRILRDLTVGDIMGGESIEFDVAISPPEDASAELFLEYLQIISDNGYSGQVEIAATITNDQIGNVSILAKNVLDDLLSGAQVTLYSQQYRPETMSYPVYTVKASASGYAIFQNIPVGNYKYDIGQLNHYNKRGALEVQAGSTSAITAVLERDMVTANLTVEETTIEDKGIVNLELVYQPIVEGDLETFPPILEALPPVISYNLAWLTHRSGKIKLTNKGSIVANDIEAEVVFTSGEENFNFELQNSDENGRLIVPSLAPGESVAIDYVAYRTAENPGASAAGQINFNGQYDVVILGERVQGLASDLVRFQLTQQFEGLSLDVNPNLIFGIVTKDIIDLGLPGFTPLETHSGPATLSIYNPTDYASDSTAGVGLAWSFDLLDLLPIPHSISLGPADLVPGLDEALQVLNIEQFLPDHAYYVDAIGGLYPGQSTTRQIQTVNWEASLGVNTFGFEGGGLTFGTEFFGDAGTIDFDLNGLGIFLIYIPTLPEIHIGTPRYYPIFSNGGSITIPRSGSGTSFSYSYGGRYQRSYPRIPDTYTGRPLMTRLKLSHELVMERDAFDATLEISNGLDVDIENVTARILILDESGNVVDTSTTNLTNALYFQAPELDNITNVNGSGVISANNVATAKWTMIPNASAGGKTSAGKIYTVRAYLTYTIDGQTFSLEDDEYSSLETTITVKPQPLLDLDYLVPKYVRKYNPFDMYIRVSNVGYGTARKVTARNGHASIEAAEEGLPGDYLVNFNINGTWVNQIPGPVSINIPFGDIAPGHLALGRINMKTDQHGYFVEFSGDYEHSDELGGEATSLVRNVRTGYILNGHLQSWEEFKEQQPDIPGDVLVDCER